MSKTELLLQQQQFLHKSKIECQLSANQKLQSTILSFENKFCQFDRNYQISAESLDNYGDDKNKNTLSISQDDASYSLTSLQKQRKYERDLKFQQQNENENRLKNEAYIAFLEQEDLQQNPTQKALCVSFNDENEFQKTLTDHSEFNLKSFNKQSFNNCNQQNDSVSKYSILNLKSENTCLKKELENQKNINCKLSQELQQKNQQIQDLQNQFEKTHNLLQYSEQLLKNNREKRSKSKDFTRNTFSSTIDEEQKFIDELIQKNYLKDNQITHLKSELRNSNLIISQLDQEIKKLSADIYQKQKEEESSQSTKVSKTTNQRDIQDTCKDTPQNEINQRFDQLNKMQEMQNSDEIQSIEKKIEILQEQKQKINYLDDNFLKTQSTHSLEKQEFLQAQTHVLKSEQGEKQKNSNSDLNLFECKQVQVCGCSTSNSFKIQPKTMDMCQFSQLERELFSNPHKNKDSIQNNVIEMESFNLSPIKNKSQKQERSINCDRSCFSTILNIEELTYRDISRNTPQINMKTNSEQIKEKDQIQEQCGEKQNNFQSNIRNLKDTDTLQQRENEKEDLLLQKLKENVCWDFDEFVENFNSNKNKSNAYKQYTKSVDFQKYQQDYNFQQKCTSNQIDIINTPNSIYSVSNQLSIKNEFNQQVLQIPHTTKECGKRFIFENKVYSTQQKQEKINEFTQYFEGKRKLSLNNNFTKQDHFSLQHQNKIVQESPLCLKQNNIKNPKDQIKQCNQNNGIQIQDQKYIEIDHYNNKQRTSFDKLSNQQYNQSNEQHIQSKQSNYLNNKVIQISQTQEFSNRNSYQSSQQNTQSSSNKQTNYSNSRTNETNNIQFLYQNNNHNKLIKTNETLLQSSLIQNSNDLKNRINSISSIENKEQFKTPVNIKNISSNQMHQNCIEGENNRFSHNTLLNSTPNNINDLFTSTPKENLTNLIAGNIYHLQQKHQDKHDLYKSNNMQKLTHSNNFEIQQNSYFSNIKNQNQGQIGLSPFRDLQSQEYTLLNKPRRGSLIGVPLNITESDGIQVQPTVSQSQIRKQIYTQGNEPAKNLYSNYTITFNQNDQKSVQNDIYSYYQQQFKYDQTAQQYIQQTDLSQYNQNNLYQKNSNMNENKENNYNLQNQNIGNNKQLNSKNHQINQQISNCYISSNLERLREVKNRVRELNLDNNSSLQFLASAQKENFPPSQQNNLNSIQSQSNKNSHHKASNSFQGKPISHEDEKKLENIKKNKDQQQNINKIPNKEQQNNITQKNQNMNQIDNAYSILQESKKVNKNILLNLQQIGQKRNSSFKSHSKDKQQQQQQNQNGSLRKSIDNIIKQEKNCLKNYSEQRTRKKSNQI